MNLFYKHLKGTQGALNILEDAPLFVCQLSCVERSQAPAQGVEGDVDFR